MTITDMTLPDEVVEKARETYHAEGMSLDAMQAAIRAALQAMVDCGMATVGKGIDEVQNVYPVIILRLDADERKEQT